MVNVKSKNNARTGGAVTSPKVDFINTGHAAQSRYIAALANPFAAPAVPIPDSFLTAHCAKIGLEERVTARNFELRFLKSSDTPTGDYEVSFKAFNNSGVMVAQKSSTTTVGARLVAAAIAFEDGAQASDIGGFVKYRQKDEAYDSATSAWETVADDTRNERNYGYGSISYNVTRRQSLDFEGKAAVLLEIDMGGDKDLILRWTAIVECDGEQGFVEGIVGQNDYVITQSIQNHHAGVFADIPHPQTTAHLPPSTTDVQPHGTHHFSDAWKAAAGWVSDAAGWAWRHKPKIEAWAKTAGTIYKDLTSFSGSITAASSGEIMSLGARAAPLLLA